MKTLASLPRAVSLHRVDHPAIEALENRIAPAGVVAVTFTGGVLTLAGDAMSNDVTVTALPQGGFEVAGNAGTPISFDGGAEVLSIVLDGAIRSLSVEMGDGGDSVSLRGLKVAGDVAIDLGGDNNSMQFDGLLIGGNFTIEGGAGGDSISTAELGVVVKRDMTVNLGDGANNINIGSFEFVVKGTLTLTGGADSDSFAINQSGALTAGTLQMDFSTGSASINMFALRLTIANSMTLDVAPASGQEVEVRFAAAGIKIGGDVAITSIGDGRVEGAFGSPLGLFGLTNVKGLIKVETGSGDDEFGITALNIKAGGVEVDLGGGQNQSMLQFGLGSLKRGLSYTGGGGDDGLSIVLLSVKTGGIEIDLGDGENVVQAQIADVTLARDFNLVAGSNDDSANIFFVGARIGGSIAVDLGAGDGSVAVGGEALSVKKDIALAFGDHPGGQAFGRLQASNVSVGGAVSMTGGQTGENQFAVSATGKVTIGSMSFTGGDDLDSVRVDTLKGKVAKGIVIDVGQGLNSATLNLLRTVTGDVRYTGGDLDDTVNVLGDGSVKSIAIDVGGILESAIGAQSTAPLTVGGLQIRQAAGATGSAMLDIAGVIVKGQSTIELADGSDSVNIADSAFAGLNLQTGGSGDTVNLDVANTGRASTFSKPVTIDLGAGDDTLNIGGGNSQSGVVFKKPVTALGGEGTDTVNRGDEDNVIPDASEFDFENDSAANRV